MALQFLFSAHHLIMLYICTKFPGNILKVFRFIKGKGFVIDRQTILGKKIYMSPGRGRHNNLPVRCSDPDGMADSEDPDQYTICSSTTVLIYWVIKLINKTMPMQSSMLLSHH